MKALLAVGAMLLLAGCERGMHDMYDQPKYKPGAPSPLFSDGRAGRAPPLGTVAAARGDEAATSSGRYGLQSCSQSQTTSSPQGPSGKGRNPCVALAMDSSRPNAEHPPVLSPRTGLRGNDAVGEATSGQDAQQYIALLQRGRQRYDIYCAPCHGVSGAGDGMVVQRGFPAPPSFTSAAMLNTTDAQIAQAIQRGYGVMYPFADRVDAPDTQAIVAYIHALQLSQHASAAQLSPQDLRALQAAEGTVR